MDHYIPPPYHRGPRKIVAFRPPLKVLAKFDESIVLGKQRISMSHNRPICLPQVSAWRIYLPKFGFYRGNKLLALLGMQVFGSMSCLLST